MNNKTIDYKYLTNELQFPEATAKAIIRQAKIKMVKSGYAIYNNKRLVTVPIFAVEEILGFKLLAKERQLMAKTNFQDVYIDDTEAERKISLYLEI